MNYEKEKEGAREGKRKVKRKKKPSCVFTFIKAKAPTEILFYKATSTQCRSTGRACFGHHK